MIGLQLLRERNELKGQEVEDKPRKGAVDDKESEQMEDRKEETEWQSEKNWYWVTQSKNPIKKIASKDIGGRVAER